MPKNSDLNAIARQWEILRILVSKKSPGITTKDLLGKLHDLGFGITKRTVERDLEELEQTFKIICNDNGMPYGWYWNANNKLDLPIISLAEALSLRLVEDLLKPLLPQAILNSLQAHFTQARAKLETLQKNNAVANWQGKVRHVPPALPLQPPDINPDVLDTVQQALLYDQQIDIEYETDKRTQQTLHPLALVQRGPVTYLVATAFNYQDARIYALHRIHSAANNGQSVKRPESFDLDAYIASGAFQFGGGENLCLKAEIWEGLAQILQETPLSLDQQIQQDNNTFTLTATVMDSWQLRWWILSQGDGIGVIEPIMLRAEIASSLKAAAEQYS
ncbi:MAG: WYL domain-containing protein [Methylovulum sp.]|nr:WYL domain-containing protein [Methylovulum sp.]